MRRALAAAILAATMAGPAPAQSIFGEREGLSRLFENLQAEIAPLLDELGARLDPYLAELQALLGDLTAWEPPEVLPNGDILIRRRPAIPEPPAPPPEEAPVTEPLEL